MIDARNARAGDPPRVDASAPSSSRNWRGTIAPPAEGARISLDVELLEKPLQHTATAGRPGVCMRGRRLLAVNGAKTKELGLRRPALDASWGRGCEGRGGVRRAGAGSERATYEGRSESPFSSY